MLKGRLPEKRKGRGNWLQKRMQKAARAERETRHFFDRQQVIQKRIQKTWLASDGVDKIDKALNPLLKQMPAEFKSAKPDIEKIKTCEDLLNARINKSGEILRQLNKSTRTAKKIGDPIRVITGMNAAKEKLEKIIEGTKWKLDTLQQWKKGHKIA